MPEIPDHVLQSHDDLVTLRQLLPQTLGRRRLNSVQPECCSRPIPLAMFDERATLHIVGNPYT